MAKDKRVIMTQEEKMAQDIFGTNGVNFHMGENKIDVSKGIGTRSNIEDLFEKEKARKFNTQVDEYTERLEKHVEGLKEAGEQLGNIESVEIKPMFNRILITPFKQNPFQRIKVENGIITDMGGLAPEFKNMDNGRIEEMEQMIITGAVQEVGPEVKYIVPGDVIMYRKETAMPVPFFKQGLMCIAETQVIAVVNEGLEARFAEIKNGN